MENGFLKFIDEILTHANTIVATNEVNEIYYRGHSRLSYSLQPGLARIKTDDLSRLEDRLFSGFAQYGNHLVSSYKSTWDILYVMQHHGLPTRLLDWSESLMTALYFAIRNSAEEEDAAIWVLDPYALNNIDAKEEELDILEYLDIMYPAGYYNYFVDTRMPEFGTFPLKTLAIGPTSPTSRIINQSGVFTFHNQREFYKPLDEVYPHVVKRFVLHREYFNYARIFLIQCKMNEFSMFPDLDGLSRYIIKNEISSKGQR